MRERLAIVSSVAVLVLTSACGYRALAAGPDAEGLHVILARSIVADAVASDEVVSGAREALARQGMLRPGGGYPRVEVEVLRVDESSEGIAAPSAALGSGAGGAPRARGTEVGVVARAWIVRVAGGPVERDTGDVRVFDAVGVDVAAGGSVEPRADLFHRQDAVRAAARRVGGELASMVLGLPVASDESMGRER
jgi:hypothetical protein